MSTLIEKIMYFDDKYGSHCGGWGGLERVLNISGGICIFTAFGCGLFVEPPPLTLLCILLIVGGSLLLATKIIIYGIMGAT